MTRVARLVPGVLLIAILVGVAGCASIPGAAGAPIADAGVIAGK